jgi:hypothetical protein
VTAVEILDLLRSDDLAASAFEALAEIARLDAGEKNSTLVQELVLRSLDRASAFGDLQPALFELARNRGLFPYVDPSRLSAQSQVAYQFHKPEGLPEVVFHAPQARVYRELMSGRSVVLSAPTSFGKSLIIDALLLSGRYRNLLVVVPTIALIDETRRRVAALGGQHKVITHLSQARAEQNVFVLTQERVVEQIDNLDVDLFVIDEFYKLSPGRGDDGRASILNHVFYALANRGVQFYMLGPSIHGVPRQLQERFECTFIYEPYETVVSELHAVEYPAEDRFRRLAELCADLDGPTIVYCQSPPRAAEVAKVLAASRQEEPSVRLRNAIRWIGDAFHPEWHLVQALRSRIGVHHGRVPRSIAQYVVRAFDNDDVDILICTSTLIEGVNTKARNVVIFDDRISTSKFDFFTFNNIRGRSGRMFEHFVGHVYLFYDPPKEELPFVDVPAVTQSEEAPASLLLQLDEDELSDASRIRVQGYWDQDRLPLAIIRANSGVEPDVQLAIADDLYEMTPEEAYRAVGWTGVPTYQELEALCQLIWRHVNGSQLGSGSVRSARQLAYKINDLRRQPSVRTLIEGQLEYREQWEEGATADEAVQTVLDFLRLWAGFHFPRLVQAVHRIQSHVLEARGLHAGDLTTLAHQVEGLFLGQAILALEEYGLPIQVSGRIGIPREIRDDLDATLGWLRRLNPKGLDLEPFELELLADTVRSLGGGRG